MSGSFTRTRYEPLSASIRLCVVRVHFIARRREAALQLVREILGAEPRHLLCTIWETRILSALGRFSEALEAARRVPVERQTPVPALLLGLRVSRQLLEEMRFPRDALARDAAARHGPVFV